MREYLIQLFVSDSRWIWTTTFPEIEMINSEKPRYKQGTTLDSPIHFTPSTSKYTTRKQKNPATSAEMSKFNIIWFEEVLLVRHYQLDESLTNLGESLTPWPFASA